jgi:hypothetical protein
VLAQAAIATCRWINRKCAAVAQAADASENKDFTVVEISGVNHLFQTAQSGSPALYGAIEETMAPEVLTAIGNWVVKHSSP